MTDSATAIITRLLEASEPLAAKASAWERRHPTATLGNYPFDIVRTRAMVKLRDRTVIEITSAMVEAAVLALSELCPMDVAFPVGGEDEVVRAVLLAAYQVDRSPRHATTNLREVRAAMSSSSELGVSGLGYGPLPSEANSRGLERDLHPLKVVRIYEAHPDRVRAIFRVEDLQRFHRSQAPHNSPAPEVRYCPHCSCPIPRS